MMSKSIEPMETFIMPHEKMQVEVFYLCSDRFYLIRFYDISTGDKQLISVKTHYEQERYDYTAIRKEIKNKLCRSLHKTMEDSQFFQKSKQLRSEIEGCLEFLTHEINL